MMGKQLDERTWSLDKENRGFGSHHHRGGNKMPENEKGNLEMGLEWGKRKTKL